MNRFALVAGGMITAAALAAPTAASAENAVLLQGKGGGHGHAQGGGHEQQGGGQAHGGRGQGSGRAQDGRTRSGTRAQGGSRARGSGSQRSGEHHVARGSSDRGGSGSARAARPSRGSGRSDVAAGRRTTGRVAESAARGSGRRTERLFGAALSHGRRHGMTADALRADNRDGRVRLTNRRGDVLLDLSDDRAREIGAWRLRRLGDRQPSRSAPAFCRSGAGHPVWGREWCLDKGFGLGSRTGTLWSRGGIDDVIFRRVEPAVRLDRGGLIDVLGYIVFGRLALQAVTLGYDQPLMGVWLVPQGGPQILQLESGGYPVAEFVDVDRDYRPEVLYVIQPL